MLDGQRYYAEFPDEEPQRPRLRLTAELLASLAAIEREISAFFRSSETSDAIKAGAGDKRSQD
jgi:hypothetical protein